MADVFVVLAVGCLFYAAYAGWRAGTLWRHWHRAVAHVWRSDYTEAQQREDLWSFGFTAFTSRGYNWRDGEDSRLIEDEVRFRTRDGREVRTLVTRRVHRGWTPSGVYTVWYDPADPVHATARGPWEWILRAVLVTIMAGVLLAQIWDWTMLRPLRALF